MRVYSISASLNTVTGNRVCGGQNKIKSTSPQNFGGIVQPNSGLIISFTGDNKNIHQFASYAPENKRYKIKAYDQGGLGVVSYEGPASWRLREGADVRDFSPYHSYDNAEGGVKVVKIPKGSNADAAPLSSFIKAKQTDTLEDIAKKINLSSNEELAYVIQLPPDAKGNSKFLRLVDAGIQGAIERPSDSSVLKSESITYRLFKAATIGDPVNVAKEVFNVAPDVKERNAVYFIHTEDLARLENAYGAGEKINNGYGTYGTYSTYGIKDIPNSADDVKLSETTGAYSTRTHFVSTNVAYADNNRAFVEILPKLNTPEHGNYAPANIWLHDRPAFMVMNAIADKSYFGNEYYNGFKVHGTFHNPGRDYQGAESNPFEFFRMVARKEDIELLNKHPQIETLRSIESRWASATTEEKRFVNKIMRPFMENFLDDFVAEAGDLRTFNITMTPIASVKLNPQNMSAGTVSVNYGKEMRSPHTPDIAQFLTNKLAEIETIDITNGSTPANLRLNDPNADFCRSGEINGLTLSKKRFTPYEYKAVIENGQLISDNIEEVLKAKKANTKWFLDSLANAFDIGGKNAVIKMFFSDNQIKDGATVLGNLFKYSDGDMLFMGWGRPDRQKGYPSTFQAFLEFLKDPNVSKDIKKHTKLIVGAGIWDEGARDYSWVKDIIRQIEELDGGIYKGNACYVNGFFPNRLVGCATHSIFTSRFEPCGITPLESFAAGTPVVSTKTGGAPDFVAATRGYLTRNAYLRSVEDLKIDAEKFVGKTGEELGNTVDAERMYANASEVRECLITATTDYGKTAQKEKLSYYGEMVKDAITQKTDWHENSAYNSGKSANERYMTEVFEINKGFSARFKGKMNRLVGNRFGIADTLIKENAQKIRNKWTKGVILLGGVVAAIGGAAYVYLRKGAKSSNAKLDKSI